MSLESGSYLSNLVSSNPTGADRKLQGDDHLRLIKSTLQNSFAGITGAVIVGGVNGGVANTYTLTPTPPLVSYVDNMSIVFSPTVANTGASTINVSGLGAVSIQSVSGAALASNDLVVGQKYRATFDGTNFRLFSVTKNYIDQLAFSTALPAQSLGFLASNGSTAAFTRTFNGYAVDESKAGNVASAATIDLQNTVVTGNYIHITGTTTITAITLPAGAERTIIFDGALTLTNNANIDIPGGANITTSVGDRAIIRGEGSGVVRVISYNRANGFGAKQAAFILLAALTPTAAANVDFLTTFSSQYDAYLIIGEGIKPSANDTLQFRLANAGVADSGSVYFQAAFSLGTATTTAVTSFNINGPTTVLAAGLGTGFELFIKNANDATNLKTMSAMIEYQTNATPGYFMESRGGVYNAANAVSGGRFLWSGGSNFAATGKIYIYGLQNT